MRSTSLVSLCLALALLARPGAVGADGSGPQARKQAQELREAGDQRYRAQDYAGALAQYRSAYEAFHSPMLLVSISAAAEMNQVPVDAALALLQFFANPGDSVPLVQKTAERNLGRIIAALSPERLGLLRREAERQLPAAAWDRFPKAAQDALPRPAAAPEPKPPVPAEPAPAPIPKVEHWPPQPIAAVPEDRRRRGLTTAKWVVGALGLLSAVAGAAMMGLDGRCVDSFVNINGIEQCREQISTQTGGIALLSAGAIAIGSSALLFGLDYRQQRSGALSASLYIGGRF